MVTQYGFSPALGNVDLSQHYSQLSTETKSLIDAEIRRLLTESYDRATRLLADKRVELERLANALMEYETLDRSEIERVIRGEQLPDRDKADVNAGMIIPAGIPQHDGTEVGVGGIMPPPLPPTEGQGLAGEDGEDQSYPPVSPPVKTEDTGNRSRRR
jgi:ATP-dependent metalloprotease